MKILYHHRIASADGQAVHMREMLQALSNLGHDLPVIGPGAAQSGAEMGESMGWVRRLRRMLPGWAYEIAELGYSSVAAYRLWKGVKAHKPDVIYERYQVLAPAGVIISRLMNIPLILEVNAPLAAERGADPGLALPWLAKWSERYVWRNADICLPVTNVLADHIRAVDVPENKIRIVHNGASQEILAHPTTNKALRAELGAEDKIILGFTGFVREWHRVDRAIRFMADHPELPLFLLLIGDGPAVPALKELADKLDVSHQMHISGFVEREEVPPMLAACDIALQPAVTAYASPLKMFEYMALKLVIIAPKQPNIQEIISDNKTGLLFDTEQEFNQALYKLCKDHSLRNEIGQAGRDRIDEAGFTWQDNAKLVLQLAAELSDKRIT